jgi:PAS domain S-box-containing protein
VEARLQAVLPSVFLFVGAVYAVLSGAVFVSIEGRWAAPLWAATAGLGVLLAASGLALRRRPLAPRRMGPLATALALLVVVHSLTVLWVTEDLNQAPYLLMLLVGAGALLSWRGMLVLDAVAILGWALVARDLGVDPLGNAGNVVAAGLLLGLAAHLARRRMVSGMAQVRRAAEGSLAASEERFRSLAETARDTILLLDGTGHLTYLNPAGLKLFGLQPSDMGRPAGHLLGPQGNEPVRLVGTTELTAQRKDGTTFPAELSLARSVREDGAVVYTGVLRDITERKKAAAAVQAAAAQDAELEALRKMNSFKTQFLNTAAHELNTPLTPLRLQLHLLKSGSMGTLNERQGKAISLLDRNVTRLSGLVGEILEVARMQSGRIRLTPATVEVDAVVDEVIESFSETARHVGVGLAFEGTPGLTVYADRNRCTQVLFNLVSNALKFTPAGGSVTIGAAAARDGQAIVVDVRDTGLGLTSEQMARLFQPFTQVHDPMAVTASGTGLGLFICKGLVEAQGGTIRVASPGPGRGATFTFTLPAGPSRAAVAAVPHEAVPASSGPSAEDPIVRRLRELI